MLKLTISSNTSIILPDALMSAAVFTLHDVVKQQQIKSTCRPTPLMTGSQTHMKIKMDTSKSEAWAWSPHKELILPDKIFECPHLIVQISTITCKAMSAPPFIPDHSRTELTISNFYALHGHEHYCTTVGLSGAILVGAKIIRLIWWADCRQLEASVSGVYTSAWQLYWLVMSVFRQTTSHVRGTGNELKGTQQDRNEDLTLYLCWSDGWSSISWATPSNRAGRWAAINLASISEASSAQHRI